MPVKKIPLRQCLGCREMKPKKELLRVVRAPDGAILLDPRGKASGRGAYVCPDETCLKKAVKSRALSRALSTADARVEIPESIFNALSGAVAEKKAGDFPNA
ncbi:MAG: YlxR family protein [Oscillospiraceae bacterium]|nr:YlxR family protein [Oscillospiraceae bacterium]